MYKRQVLDYALVSSPGAPVKQALIDAGIGDDVYGSYDAGILQPVFSFVAKNANASQADEFESIIAVCLLYTSFDRKFSTNKAFTYYRKGFV